jgi:cation diffusion facilitator CzcD-associated flavoprotein CzcO
VTRRKRKQRAWPAAHRRDQHVVIVGAGFSGIGMAVRLLADGERDFVLLERASELGGTWRDNTYPGCRCDVPSHLYSFSFAPNPNWSSTFSPQTEILEYLRGVAHRYGVTERVRFDCELQTAEWDEACSQWRLTTSQGPMTADVLICGQGPLSELKLPEVEGLEGFEGTLFHSAAWDHDHDLRGERVAVIGTGASAIQFVPRIQPEVAQMYVYQRTAPWVVPHPNRALRPIERALYRRLPFAQLAMRAAIYWARESLVLQFRHRRMRRLATKMALRQLEAQVPDPELRERLTPPYELGCKRILPTNEWYPALLKPNVEVVTDAIREVRGRSIVTADGGEREVDTIILGTGFHVTDLPIAGRIRGREGRSLDELWDGSPRAYKGVAVAGFPNLFFLVGPNSGLGHSSIVFMIESQVAYVAEALRVMRRRGARTMEVRGEAESSYNRELEELTRGTVWVTGGCASYYIDRQGRNSALWPYFTWPFRRRTREFDEDAYALGAPA